MNILIATARAEVVKPLDTDWDTLGKQLRALMRPLHRVLNHALSELELMSAGKLLGLGGGHEQTLSYQLTRDYWRLERQEAADRVSCGKSYAGDDDIATVAPASSVILGCAGAVYAKWQRYSKERWKGTMALPTFRRNQPIEIASSSDAVRLGIEDGSLVLDVRMVADSPRTRLVIRPYGGSGYSELRRVAANPEMLGSCKLLCDDGKWNVLLAVKRATKETSGKRTMALHRGVRTFLTAAVMGCDRRDAMTMVIADGGDIQAHKDAYSARRRSLGRHQRERGDGSRGHGKERRFEAINKLEGAEANWVKTRCQQVAARVVRIAEQRGVDKILIEDWGNPAKDGSPELGEYVEKIVRQFPLAQLKGAIVWAAQNAGIEVAEVETKDYSLRCPNCGYTHDAKQFPVFRCTKCQLTRPADMMFPWNMLVDHAGATGSDLVKSHNRTLKSVRERMLGR